MTFPPWLPLDDDGLEVPDSGQEPEPSATIDTQVHAMAAVAA